MARRLTSYLFKFSFFSFHSILELSFKHIQLFNGNRFRVSKKKKISCQNQNLLRFAICRQFLTCKIGQRESKLCIPLPIKPIHDQSVTAPRYNNKHARWPICNSWELHSSIISRSFQRKKDGNNFSSHYESYSFNSSFLFLLYSKIKIFISETQPDINFTIISNKIDTIQILDERKINNTLQ